MLLGNGWLLLVRATSCQQKEEDARELKLKDMKGCWAWRRDAFTQDGEEKRGSFYHFGDFNVLQMEDFEERDGLIKFVRFGSEYLLR